MTTDTRTDEESAAYALATKGGMVTVRGGALMALLAVASKIDAAPREKGGANFWNYRLTPNTLKELRIAIAAVRGY